MTTNSNSPPTPPSALERIQDPLGAAEKVATDRAKFEEYNRLAAIRFRADARAALSIADDLTGDLFYALSVGIHFNTTPPVAGKLRELGLADEHGCLTEMGKFVTVAILARDGWEEYE